MTETPLFNIAPLEHVRADMTVVDADGLPLGRVVRVAMGDPDAVTMHGNEPVPDSARETVLAPRPAADGGALMPAIAPGSGEIDSDVPAPLRSELRRAGFIELDAPDLQGWARYVPGDRVAEVVGQTVRLRPVPTAASEGAPSPAQTRPAAPPAPQPVAVEPSPSTLGEFQRVGRVSWVASGAVVVACGGVAGVWVYRRKREQARVGSRLRRVSRVVTDTLTEPDRTTAGGLGIVLLLSLLLARALRGARGADVGRESQQD
jgi:hypothetical protein